MEIRKILFAGLLVACFSGAFADKPLVEEILQSGALPTGSATLAALNDKNGESVTQSVLQGADFWNNDIGINWDPSTSGTIGNPWLKTGTALPIQHTGQEGYSPFYDTTITVDSTDDYKNITGLYGYKITINLTNDLNFEGESLPPLFNIVAFIGNNHTISNFYIKSDCQYAGLLATVTDSVCDLTLEINGFENISNTSNAGALVGYLPSNAKIWNCRVVNNTTGVVTVSGTSYVGGLVGYSDGTIDSCSVSRINVQASDSCAGGLVGGGSISSITNCTVNTVTITIAKDYAGGLIGKNTSTSTTGSITSCTARNVTIKSSGGSFVGGLTGKSLISISNCQASKIYIQGIYGGGGGLVGELIGAVANCKVDTVSVSGATKIGGLVGNSLNLTGTITNCAVDSVAITATGSFVGGLIGYNKATIDGCSANRVVVKGSTSGDSYAGGLVGQSNDKDVKNSKVTNGTITGNNLLGGLVGHTLSGNLYNDTVSNVIVTASSGSQAGGLTSYLAPPFIVEYCEVKNCTISGQEKIAGLVGLSSGFKIANSKVMGGTVRGTSYIGGLVGHGDNASTNTTRCAVDNVTVTASGSYVGGLIGYNLGNISDCSVSRAPLSAYTYLGGIVGYSKGLVLRCLVTGTTITSSNTNADDGFVAGVVGYNNTGWVRNCVAMIKYFDIKAKYTKSGEKFGRIVSNKGNLSQNYGWVETAIRYWHYRFGINWGTDYYKGTGQTGNIERNGENLFIGDKHTGGFAMAKDPNFWTGIEFTSDNGWETGSVGGKFYPQLTIAKDDDLGSIGDARGFEYEAKLITDNAGNYQGKTVNIFTPQFFSNYVNGSYCAYFGNSFCNLYTDIELATEDGNGNTVFWSTDLNGGLAHNFTYSAIRLHDDQALTFDGKGHSIINLHKEHSNSYNDDDHFSSGFFHAPKSDLTINRLELENPVGFIYYAEESGIYLRYGFLVTMGTSVGLNDIYVKNPRLITHSSYPTSYGKIVWDFNVNGVAGTLVGSANYINGSNVVVYFSEGSYMRGAFISDDYPSSFTHYGCLFGSISYEIKLNGVAVSVYNSDPARRSLYNQTYRAYRDEGGSETKPFLKGFISGLRGNSTTLDLGHYSFHDGYTGNFAGLNPVDANPNGSWGYPVPWILKLGEYFGFSDVGTSYPNAGSFYQTLVKSGIKNQPNWFIPESYTDDGVHLKRDEYTENYQ